MRKIAAIALVLLMPTTAFAQLPQAGEAMKSAEASETKADTSEVKTPPVTTYDFETDEVKGGINKPLGEDINAPQHGKTSSLITVRKNFVVEVVKSVEDL